MKKRFYAKGISGKINYAIKNKGNISRLNNKFEWKTIVKKYEGVLG